MLKVGLIGLGCMGRTHLKNYIRLMNEGFPLQLTAICDVDEDKFNNIFIKGNINNGSEKFDFSKYNLYTKIDEMLDKEDFDYIDICLPTYLHAEITIKALNMGIHVFCEKPMALTSKDCERMIEAAEKNDRKLMIGQCLRFFPQYEYLKECVDTKKYGEVTCGYFYRGGGTPKWSFENWLLKKEKSGGCLIDQHIHDVDTIHWLFGKPVRVSTSAKNVIPGSGYDVVSTNYMFEDGKVINAQDDWTLNGKVGFKMLFRVNFEKASLTLENGAVTVYPNGEDSFAPELCPESGYYREICYFANSIINNSKIIVVAPESAMNTLKIAEAEIESADKNSEPVKVK
ncbi:MAG: Gfo/Idh/MocA family oxidoreductase [Bacillota bacterium]|nr:Gfo/Idh/MocA family oxidoreductase [Bacillota bacterium]